MDFRMTTVAVNTREARSSESAARARRFNLPSPFTVFVGVVIGATAVVIFAPITIMFLRTLLADGTLNTQAFADTFARPGLGEAVLNSLIIVIAVNLTAVPVGTLFAWLNFRTNARMGPLTTLLPILPLLLPSVAVAIGWVFLGSDESGFLTIAIRQFLGLFGIDIQSSVVHIFTWPGLLMLYFLEIMPVVYVIVGAAYRSTDSSLEEAARINGSGVFKTFITISVPIVRPAILLSTLLASVLAIGIYSIPAIVGSTAKIPTLSVHLVRLLNGEFPPRIDEAAVISLFLILVFGAFWMLQQRLNAFGRHAQIGGQGMRSASILLSRPAQLIARTSMIAYVALISILPVVALLLVSLQPYWTPEVDFATLSLENFMPLLEDPHSRAAVTNSMILATVGSFLTLLVAAIVMVYAIANGGVREKFMGVLTKVPAALSHLVIAAGIMIGFGGAPLYLANSMVILGIAYFVLYIPKASIAAEAAFRQLGPQLSEASRICGAGGARTMRRIVLPLMLPGLAAGWALIFASIIGELTASVILAGPHNPVMGYLIMTSYEAGTYSQLAALATVIAVMSGLTVGSTMALARPKFSNLTSP
jgi:iron(III) transport system permease protein